MIALGLRRRFGRSKLPAQLLEQAAGARHDDPSEAAQHVQQDFKWGHDEGGGVVSFYMLPGDFDRKAKGILVQITDHSPVN